MRDAWAVGWGSHEAFEDFAVNRLDLEPRHVERLIKHGRWSSSRPPRLTSYGEGLAGEDGPPDWRIERAPTYANYGLPDRSSGPATVGEYGVLVRYAVGRTGVERCWRAAQIRAQGGRDAAAFAAMFVLGLKPGELVALPPSAYDARRGVLTAGGRTLPVTGHVLKFSDQHVKNLPRHAPTLFPAMDRKLTGFAGPATANAPKVWVERAWCLSSDPTTWRYRGPSPMDLRAAFAARLKSTALSVNAQRELLGLRSRRTAPRSDSEERAVASAVVGWEEAVGAGLP